MILGFKIILSVIQQLIYMCMFSLHTLCRYNVHDAKLKIFSGFSFIHSSNIKSIIKIRKQMKNIYNVEHCKKILFSPFSFWTHLLIRYIKCTINFLSCKLQLVETIARVAYHEQPYLHKSFKSLRYYSGFPFWEKL